MSATVYKIKVTVECLKDDVVRHSHTDHVVFTDPTLPAVDSAWLMAHAFINNARLEAEAKILAAIGGNP